MRFVVTLADNNVTTELTDWLYALRNYGFKDKIVVFTPTHSRVDPKFIPDELDVEIKGKRCGQSEKLDNIGNKSCLIKPKLFLDPMFSTDDQILYTDSIDLLVLTDANAIFDKLEPGNIMAARGFGRSNQNESKLTHLREKFNLDLSVLRYKSELNSGVILVRMCPKLKEYMELWSNILDTTLENGSFFDNGKGKIGDQVGFNLIARLIEAEKLFNSLGEEYNYRGLEENRSLIIKNDRLFTPGKPNGRRAKVLERYKHRYRRYSSSQKRIFVPHASGPGNLRREVRNLAYLGGENAKKG